MKKMILLLTILFLPFSVLAYSDKLIPGGDTLGIEIQTNGLMVIGFYKIDNKFNKGSFEIKSGDYITHVNNKEVNSVDDMTSIIENAANKEYIDIILRRNNKEYNTKLPLIENEGKYKTGLFVKSSIKGIGTLTYIDPITKTYGALGHEIIESESNSIVELKTGYIFENIITGIERSAPGTAGSKLGRFNINNKYGSITKNTQYGIFGNYELPIPKRELLEVSDDIKVGNAYIKTVINENEISDYLIEITSVNKNKDTKNIIFKINDKSLIEKTGGVVQGMSGSPIIQNNKIVGVVTHVVIDNPISGYGLLITNMLSETDSN